MPVLVDDVWPTKDRSTGFLTDLLELLRESPDSRMIVSTRSAAVAQCTGCVVTFDAQEPLRSQCEMGSLKSGILLSLEFLEAKLLKWKLESNHDIDYSIDDLYIGLCVLRPHMWVPLSVLSRLWQLDEGDAMHVMELFCEMSLATLRFALTFR